MATSFPSTLYTGAYSEEYSISPSLSLDITCILFSFMSYFNGHGKTVFVMAQGLAQTFLVRLPVSYIMSILPNTNLMLIGTAAPAATLFGIVLNVIYYRHFQKRMQARSHVL